MNDPENRDENTRARRGRNLALGLGLAVFAIIVFVVTLVRLGGNVVERSF